MKLKIVRGGNGLNQLPERIQIGEFECLECQSNFELAMDRPTKYLKCPNCKKTNLLLKTIKIGDFK